MGADLIVAIAVMPGEYAKPNWPSDEAEWLKQYHEAVWSLDKNTLFELLEEYQGELYFDDEEGHIRSREYMRIKKVRLDLDAIIDETLNLDSRDCGFYKIGSRWALITGGMSWGDNPSDSYQAVQLLSNIWYCAHGE